MKNIVLARIDDRLIHGQVVVSWLRYVKANEIIVIDEEIAKDDFLKQIVMASAPEEVNSNVFTIEESITYLKEEQGSERIIILSKTPQILQTLIEKGIKFEKVNLGGVGFTNNRKRIFKSISLNDEEINSLKEIEKLGTKVEIQILPNDKINSLSEVI